MHFFFHFENIDERLSLLSNAEDARAWGGFISGFKQKRKLCGHIQLLASMQIGLEYTKLCYFQ